MDALDVDALERLLPRYDLAGPRYTSYPTAPVWSEAFGAEEYAAALGRLALSEPAAARDAAPRPAVTGAAAAAPRARVPETPVPGAAAGERRTAAAAPRSGSAQQAARPRPPWAEAELRAALRTLVDATGDEELVARLRTITRRPPDELRRVRDLRRYAVELGSRVLAGVEGPALEAPTAPVEFAPVPVPAALERADAPLRSSEERIFASFPMPEGGSRNVLAKWYRADRAELLALDALPVREEDGWGWVSLARPEGFPAGAYRLELLGNDDALEPIAAGSFETVDTGRPPTVVFR